MAEIEILDEVTEVELFRRIIEDQRETIKGLIEALKNIQIPIYYYQPTINPGIFPTWPIYPPPYQPTITCQEGASWAGSTLGGAVGGVQYTLNANGGSKDQM